MPISHRLFSIILLAVALTSCAAGEQRTEATGAPSSTGAGSLPPVEAQAPADTVNWNSAVFDGNPPPSDRKALEQPGERLGLIGPIVATGGLGAKRYFIVYDPAGVPVGALTYAQVRQEPQRLEALIEKARARGEIQNYRALQYMRYKHFIAERLAERK
jgi:hypothetical protein